MLPDAMPVSIHLGKAQYHVSQQTTARSCVWANTPTGYAKTGTRRQLELEGLHMSEKSLGAPKDFSKLDLANTAICTTSDRRFMDHKAYQNTMQRFVWLAQSYNWLKSHDRIVYQHHCPATAWDFLGLLFGLLICFCSVWEWDEALLKQRSGEGLGDVFISV